MEPIFESGDTISDRYTIEDVIGEGGYSTVYLVSDNKLSSASQIRYRALKILHNQPHPSDSALVLDSFSLL